MAIAAVNGDNRRGKTALFLFCCGFLGAWPHWVDPGKNLLPAITLAIFLGGYGLITVLRDRNENHLIRDPQIKGLKDGLPSVDVVVAARDEENVIERLVTRLLQIEYPKDKLSITIIDDGSQDQTPYLLEELSQNFSKIKIIKRPRFSGGGKSGALNFALTKLHNDWLFILDADAQLHKDVLIRSVVYAIDGGWSAVQLRKAIVNRSKNKIASLQSMEMAMDAVIQSGRLASGGISELRGNGQLINRNVLDQCGGFNEDTVTDDLDLSFRLLINKFSIGLLWNPPVEEEAVDSVSALIRQRQRWAEGGLQRFFDYWTVLISRKLRRTQKIDLTCFFLLQYALPVISFMDCVASIFTASFPVYWPFSLVAFSVSGLAYWKGCMRDSEGPSIPKATIINIFYGILYLSHWFFVIPLVAIKMTLLPKKLIWKKTNHIGI